MTIILTGQSSTGLGTAFGYLWWYGTYKQEKKIYQSVFYPDFQG